MPTTSQRAYKAVFFDLDGTLLPVDMDAFLQAYFKALGKYAADHGQEPKQFTDALNKGVFAMIKEEGGRNDERFWQTFCSVLGIGESEMPAYEQLMEGFYNTAFDELGALISPTPESAQVVNLLREKGYRLYLTTMPLFPRIASRWKSVSSGQGAIRRLLSVLLPMIIPRAPSLIWSTIAKMSKRLA